MATALVFILLGFALAQLPLYVMDCGTHGDFMMSLVEPNATFLNIGLEGCEGPSFDEALLGVRVVPSRLSLSWGEPVEAFSFNLQLLLAQGEQVWAAAGNDGEDTRCNWPANASGVTAVMALDSWGRRRSLSNGCTKKNGLTIGVSACSTSEATAIAANANASSDIVRWSICEEDKGFIFFCMVIGAWVLFLCAFSAAWLLPIRPAAQQTASPELASKV